MPDTPASLAIVLVLYHAYKDTEVFLATQGPVNDQLRYIVVDNTPHASADHAAQTRIAARPGVTLLIADPENLGYAGAANFALLKLPELVDIDYFALSNTDLAYDAVQIQHTLTETREEHVGVGLIAPRLTMTDGSPKTQLHYIAKPSRARYARLAKIFSNYPLAIAHRLASDLKRSLGYARERGEVPRRIFAPHGAFMIATRSYISQSRGFAHPAFLFCEEIYVGAECQNAGLECIYEPRLSYAHDYHGSMGRILSRRMVGHLREAHLAVLPLLD